MRYKKFEKWATLTHNAKDFIVVDDSYADHRGTFLSYGYFDNSTDDLQTRYGYINEIKEGIEFSWGGNPFNMSDKHDLAYKHD